MDSLLDAKDKLSLPISKSQSCNALSTLGHIPKKRGPDLHFAHALKNSTSVSNRISNNLVSYSHLNNPELDLQHDLLEGLKKNLHAKKYDIVAAMMESAQRRLSNKSFSQFLASLHQIGLLEKSLKICLERPQKAMKDSLSPQTDQWSPFFLRQNIGDGVWLQNMSQMNLLNHFFSNTKFKHEFEEHEVLGKGGFGVVVKAKRRFDGASYAVKKIKFRMKHLASSHTILREVRALAQLDHPNICRYYNSWIEIDEDWGPEGFGAAKALDVQTVQASEKEESSVKIKEISVSTEARILAQQQRQQLKTSASTSLSNSNTTTPVQTRKSFNPRASADNSIVFEESSKQSNNNSFNSVDSRVIPYREASDAEESTESGSQQTENSSDKGQSSSDQGGYDSDDDQESKGLSPVPYKKSGGQDLKSMKMILYIQMQYYSNSTLSDFLSSDTRSVDITQVRKIFHQIVEGVREIHSKGFIHRDLKPKNIFLSDDHTVKIGDFGLSKSLDPVHLNLATESSEKALVLSNSSDHTFGLGTASYASPEQLHGSSYDHKADMFSLGIILFELLSQFGTASERIFSIKQLREEILPEEFVLKFPQESMVIKSLLSKLPHLRPNAVDLLNNVNLWSSNTQVETLLEKLSSSEEIIQSQSQKISQLEEQIKLLQAKITGNCTTSA